MLPSGHAAAGYLVAVGIGVVLPQAGSDMVSLLAFGALCGALPDIDMLAAFAKTRSLVIENEKQSHRAYITHTPVFWIVVALFMLFVSSNASFAIIVLLAPLSHLFLDSLEDEIQWLGPWLKKGYSIFKRKKALAIPRQDFFSYWKKFLFWYIKNRKLTATAEMVLLIIVAGMLAYRQSH